MEQTFRVGVYCRLSKNDDNPGESTSIETQRSIVLDYCAEHDYQVFDVYVDDGAAGLNFEREGFQRLLADVESETRRAEEHYVGIDIAQSAFCCFALPFFP